MALARDRIRDGVMIVSVFVNPLQFGDAEDLARYPRTLASDVEMCAAAGVDVVFAPPVSEMYPNGEPEIAVDPGARGDLFEGASRPGHFRGVLTVVAKLFGLARPDVAVFGEKDFQQLALIKAMVRDLSLGIDIVGGPTLREPDGLAMSSRNRFLSKSERVQAAFVNKALRAAQGAAGAGRSPERVRDLARAELAASSIDVDYLAIAGPDLTSLPPLVDPGTGGRILVAARVGGIRLIDNMPLVFGPV